MKVSMVVCRGMLGIFRALDVRFVHVEFATQFEKFKPLFIANLSREMEEYLRRSEVAYNNIPLQPRFFVDPVRPVLKKNDFSPWLEFDAEVLEKVIRDTDIFEIYEPYFFYSDQIARMAKEKDKPLITEIWTSFPQHPSQYVLPYSLLVKSVVEKTDLFVLRSQKALTYLDPFKIPEEKKVVIYHGVNIDRFYPAKKSHEKITLLFVGALDAHKGLDDLLAVFPELVEKYKNKLELVICGVGPLQKLVVQMAKKFPITYKGFVLNSQLPEIYRDADIYCQPSKDFYFLTIKGGEEFAGYTFMEALASGLPIVSTYCGGISEIVGNDNALIDQGDRKKLFQAIDTYISNPHLRKETGLKNRERAEKLFDLSKQVKLLETIIKKKLM